MVSFNIKVHVKFLQPLPDNVFYRRRRVEKITLDNHDMTTEVYFYKLSDGKIVTLHSQSFLKPSPR